MHTTYNRLVLPRCCIHLPPNNATERHNNCCCYTHVVDAEVQDGGVPARKAENIVGVLDSSVARQVVHLGPRREKNPESTQSRKRTAPRTWARQGERRKGRRVRCRENDESESDQRSQCTIF